MSRADYFAPGQWNFYCDLCGRKNKSGNAMLTWDGHYVCKEHKEVRNPQDFVRGVAAEAAIPWRRTQGPAWGGWFALGIQTAALSGFGTGKWPPRGPQTQQLTFADSATTPSESVQQSMGSNFNLTDTATASESFSLSTPVKGRALNSSSINASLLG
jgi:hypothetical protein